MASIKKRGTTYYAQYYRGGQQVRRCLHTTSLQVAREKLRQLESQMYRGEEPLGPTRTPLPDALEAYVAYARVTKTINSLKSDRCFLRQLFGPICPSLHYVRRTPPAGFRYVTAAYVEELTTSDLANCIAGHVQNRGLAAKTANRMRKVASRFINWAVDQYGVRLVGDRNPAAFLEARRVPAPQITFLSERDITCQLDALTGDEHGSTLTNPFNSLAEGVAYVAEDGTLILRAGTTTETPRLTKPMRLTRHSGDTGQVVRIGVTGGTSLATPKTIVQRFLADLVSSLGQ
jgi:hypothetical protein